MLALLLFTVILKDVSCALKVKPSGNVKDGNRVYSKENANVTLEFTIYDDTSSIPPPPTNESVIELIVKDELVASIFFKNGKPEAINENRTGYTNRLLLSIQGEERVLVHISNLVPLDFQKKTFKVVYTYSDFELPDATIDLIKAEKPVITNANYFSNGEDTNRRATQLRGWNGNYLCTASGLPEPTVTWYKQIEKNGGLTFEQKSGAVGEAKLKIENAKTEDFGKYTCIAKNEAGEDQKTMFLFIYYIEYTNVNENFKTLELSHDEKINQDCEIRGQPGITYQWKNPKGEVIESDSALSQKITKFGNYSCIAKNEAGTLEFTVEIKEASSKTTSKPVSEGSTESAGDSLQATVVIIYSTLCLLSVYQLV